MVLLCTWYTARWKLVKPTHSHSGGPNHADCETNYNCVHFLVVEPDRSSPAEAFSAFTLCEGRCTGAGAGACAAYRRHRLCTQEDMRIDIAGGKITAVQAASAR